MPLHDVGYRSWEGKRTSLFGRWSVVAKTGVSLAFRSTWLSRTLILSVVPAIAFAIAFFFFEQSVVIPEYREFFAGAVMVAGGQPEMARSVALDPASVRHEVWASLLLIFFRNPQSVAMLVVVGLVAPRLISADLRNRGYLLYFSRPVTPTGYVAGKALVVWTFLALITTAPALFLYLLGICLSPDFTVLAGTWDLPFRIFAGSVVLMLPVSAVALACSSITIESRYAAFSWFAIWIVGWLSYSILFFGQVAGQAPSSQKLGGGDIPRVEIITQSYWELLSPFHCLGRVQQYVFGVYSGELSIVPYIIMLTSVTVFGFWLVRNRVMSRLRA
jgi:ABC-2 type transport system permease protein